MSDITSTISETPLLTSTVSGSTTVQVSTFSEGGRTLSELTDIDLQGVANGSLLIYDTNEFVARTLSGDATINSDGVLTLNPSWVNLGTDTSGAYISTVTGTSDQITVLGSGGETANITLSLPQSIATSSSPSFNNITLSGVINNTDLNVKLSLKAPLDSPSFTGIVSGITKGMVGLSAVDNTSDLDKPLSIAQQTALNLKANIANPTFTGTVSGITASMVGLANVDNTSDINKPLSSATISALGLKVDKVSGQGLSDNNYTLVEKNKLAGIADGATSNSTDAHLLSRANHTGSQSYTTITGLGTLATQNGTFSGSSSGTNTGDQTITLGGDASGSGTGLVNVTLASTGVAAGEYNNSGGSVTPFTVDIKGRITAVDTPITLTPSWNNVTNKPSTLGGYGISDAVDTFSSQVIGGSKEFSTSPTVPLVPTAAGHAASKAYVDTFSEGLHVHAAVHAILTVPLATAIGGGVTIDYTNGTDGVNAKLTASSAVTWTSVFADTDITSGSRVIIAGQGASAHNGIYTVSSATELTRASDFDTPTEMAGGDFVFVTHGTYADTGWVLSEPVTQVGVSPVVFTQFSGAGAYEAGAGLARDGTTFNVVAGTGISVDGSVSLSTIGSPGTYRSVTVDAYGRVTSGSNPTTLSGYGITDAASSTALSDHISDATVHLTSTQNTLLDGITVTSDKVNYLSSVSSNIQTQLDGKQPLDADLTAIAALSETNGFLKKSASNTWILDSSNYSLSSHSHADATTSVSGFLSASDKVKVDGAVQTIPGVERGYYDNGSIYAIGDIVSTPVGSPYGSPGQRFIRISNPGNPGYPPGTSSWGPAEAGLPPIGSPAFSSNIQAQLDGKSAIGHTHSTSNITNLYQPTPEQDPDATSAMMYNGGYKLDLVGLRSYYYDVSGVFLGCSYNSSTNRWDIYDNESTFLTSTSDGLYPWLATWPGNAVAKYSYPRVAGAALAATAFDGVSNYAARADHVHPYPTALQIGAAPLVGGKVPMQYMPSAVDDILVFSDRSDFPATGESGKIYLARNEKLYAGMWYEEGRMYYWGPNSSYIEIAPLSVYNPSDADAFVVWATNTNGTFKPTGITNGRPSYTRDSFTMEYDGGKWIIYSVGEEYYLEAQAAPGTEAYPWLANWGTSNYITRVGSYSYSQSLIPRKSASIGSSGTSGRSAREDHVHPLPTAEEIGAASDSNTIIGLSIFL